MQRKVPAEKARAPAVSDDAAAPGRCPPSPSEEQDHAGGNHQPEAEIHEVRRPAGRDPPRTMSEVIVKASAGLCTSVATRTPVPRLPMPSIA